MTPRRLFFPFVMLLAAVSAFAVPSNRTSPARSIAQGAFTPISAPARSIAAAIYGRRHPTVAPDDGQVDGPRADESIRAENHALRTELLSLRVKFDELSRLNADRQAVGPIRNLCEPAKVTGGDGSTVRESLHISPTSAVIGRPVIHDHDLVGRVTKSGPAGGEVRLITDPGFAFTARIGRYVPQPDGGVKLVFAEKLKPLVRGIGHGQMAATGTLSMSELADAKIVPGDWVVLDDAEWPPNVQGVTAGKIVLIRPQANAPLTADVRIEPAIDLPRLSEVMVMVKD